MDKLNNENLKNPFKEEEINYKEFYIFKDNSSYKVVLKQSNKNISINIESYQLVLYLKELQNLINKKIYSLEKFFSFFIDSFEKNKIQIKEIESNKIIKLVFKRNNELQDIEDNEIELILIHNHENKDYIINNLNKTNFHLLKNISDLNNQMLKLKNEIFNININQNYKIINKINSFSLIKTKDMYYSPLYLQFQKNISTDSYAHFALDNTFIIVNSISNINYIIYSSKSKSIISQNIDNFQIISEIKNAHENYITNFKYFFDEENKRDIIMSISAEDNNIKLWDLKDWKCINDIKKINQHGSLFSACFFRDQKLRKNFIFSSNDYYSNSEKIKLLDFKGNKIKEINDSNHRTYIMEIYYDNNMNKNFIVTGNELGIISYDFEENKIYNKYIEKCEDLFLSDHNSLLIIKEKDLVKIIESSEDGCIRIWDFHKAMLLNKIEISEKKLFGICLWNKDYLFVGCDDNTLKLIEIKKNFVINNIKTEGFVINAKKLNHIKYKDCLITQDWRNQIKIWIIKN